MSGNQERFQQAMNQGHSAAWDQNWGKAAAFYRQALEVSPNQPQALTSLGLALVDLQQYEEALLCYQKAAKAVNSGLFDPELVPIDVEVTELDGNEKPIKKNFTVKRDEGPRADTNIEALAKLKPAFKEGGVVTAGNSSQMSDGAAGVVVMSAARARQLGLEPLARFVAFAVGGVAPELMGIGPVVAIPKALKIAGLTLNDVDLIELNEAFAARGRLE